MRLLATVIYTDKLDQVREFWTKYFVFPVDEGEPNSFSVIPFTSSKITYVDAATAGCAPSQGMQFRLTLPYPVLEQARLRAAGVECSELKVESWGSYYGNNVQYFSVIDPSGAELRIFEDRYGEDRQLMTIGDGRGTKAVQSREDKDSA